MSVHHILDLEALVFVFALALLVAWKLLTAQINMSGLFMDKSRPDRFSPERAQLLISTLAVCADVIRNVSISQEGVSFSQIGSGWLALLGGSSAIYSARKIVERFDRQEKK